MKKLGHIFILLSVSACFSLRAQESITPLRYYQAPTQQFSDQQKEQQLKLDRAVDTTIFLVDTLTVPFRDDFSRNRIRSLAFPDPARTVDTTQALFRVNGKPVDSLKIMDDTTYTLVFDSTGNPTFTPNDMVTAIFYAPGQIGVPIDTVTGWPAYEREVDGNDTTYNYLTPDHAEANSTTEIRLVFDSEFYKWTADGPLLNNSLAAGPPTYGVVSFDGVDKSGNPYDMSMPQTYGLADELTSKPIDLNYNARDDVYLSFFYQPGGLGEEPNPQDSLVLEFYSPVTDNWHHAWSTPGEAMKAFEEVFINITDTLFLQRGFRFRFRNYATLSGSFDLWHIDYVRLNYERSENDEIDDIAYQAFPDKYLKEYSSVPWKQYKKNPGQFMAENMLIDMSNLSEAAKIFTSHYHVYDEIGTHIFTSEEVGQTHASGLSAPATSPFKIQHSLVASPNSFNFPVSGYANKRRVSFQVKHTVNTTPDANRTNDTITDTQVFDTYLAYDDGIAEQAYSLNGAGARLAYKFELSYEDTLKALLINFPAMLENVSQHRFKIMIWKDLGDGPIYEGPLRQPVTTGSHNFVRFPLDEPQVLNGEFYIGWLQSLEDKLYVGLDMNTDRRSKIWYSVNNIDWINSSFEGALLIRPDFGVAHIPPVAVEEAEVPQKQEQLDITIYPNPASNQVNMVSKGEHNIQFQLMDLQGRTLQTGNFKYRTALPLGNFAPGMYLLKLHDPVSHQYDTKRLIIR